MNKFVALVQFLFALSGCAMDGASYNHRVVDNGRALLDSRAQVQDGVARFECRASDSGWCHYTLYPEACAGKPECALAPLRTFRVARGESHQVAGLAGFRPCVDAQGHALGPDCRQRSPAVQAQAR
jgi:hypothetical protein